MSAISFCDWEMTTAMSVLAHEGDLTFHEVHLLGGEASPAEGLFIALESLAPESLDLLVGPHGGDLVDGDDHGLAGKPSAEEVIHDVSSDRVQPVISGDQLVLLP